MSLFAEFVSKPSSETPIGPAEGLILRGAREEDLGPLSAMAAERSGRDPGVHRAFYAKLLGAPARKGRALVIVASWEERIVGFGVCRRFTPPRGAPAHVAPAGWYLAGLIVTPALRRRGIGRQLTRARLDWIARRSETAHYVANLRNTVSIELHRRLGFVELTRDFWMPGVRFEGGRGALYRCALTESSPSGS